MKKPVITAMKSMTRTENNYRDTNNLDRDSCRLTQKRPGKISWALDFSGCGHSCFEANHIRIDYIRDPILISLSIG